MIKFKALVLATNLFSALAFYILFSDLILTGYNRNQ